ncbi:MAG: TonB C-terminal domain-containing protein [Methylococcales bacterium]
MSNKKHYLVYLPRVVGVILIIGIIYSVVTFIQDFLDKKPVKKGPRVQKITLFKPPPPPPPPPPQEELPPEPELEEQVEPEPEPENLPDISDEAPAESLGLDADGSAGSDGFGLAARKGGRGLLAGNPNAWYAGIVKSTVLDAMMDRDELRRRAYSAYINIWLDIDGSVLKYKLIRSSGDADIDKVIKSVLAKVHRVSDKPPVGMKQPIKLKITSRM